MPISTFSDYYSPENVKKFGDYLFGQSDFMRAAGEYQRYLYSGSLANRPDVLYQLGVCYQRVNQVDVSEVYFFRAAQEYSSHSGKDSANIAYAAVLLESANIHSINKFDSLQTEIQDEALKIRLDEFKALHYLRDRQWRKVDEILSERMSANNIDGLQQLLKKGQNTSYKSPSLAGLMSTLIPGSGRFYAGRFVNGFYSAILIGGTAWLSYEGFRDHGAYSAKGWIFGGLATAFYSSNIYGAVIAARRYNERAQLEYQNDIQLRIKVAFQY